MHETADGCWMVVGIIEATRARWPDTFQMRGQRDPVRVHSPVQEIL